MKYVVRDRETGTMIEETTSYEQAEKIVEEFKEQDKAEGNYVDNFYEIAMECCICGRAFSGYGNNPDPVVKDENARCCDDCNASVVIPKRIEML